MNEDPHKSWSNFIFIILTGHQLPNFNQTFRHFKILTKPSFRISTKIKLHNLNQASAAKYWSNFSFKILPELQLQNLYQTLYSKSEQSLGLAFSQARVRSIKSFTNILFLVDSIKERWFCFGTNWWERPNIHKYCWGANSSDTVSDVLDKCVGAMECL